MPHGVSCVKQTRIGEDEDETDQKHGCQWWIIMLLVRARSVPHEPLLGNIPKWIASLISITFDRWNNCWVDSKQTEQGFREWDATETQVPMPKESIVGGESGWSTGQYLNSYIAWILADAPLLESNDGSNGNYDWGHLLPNNILLWSVLVPIDPLLNYRAYVLVLWHKQRNLISNEAPIFVFHYQEKRITASIREKKKK